METKQSGETEGHRLVHRSGVSSALTEQPIRSLFVFVCLFVVLRSDWLTVRTVYGGQGDDIVLHYHLLRIVMFSEIQREV